MISICSMQKYNIKCYLATKLYYTLWLRNKLIGVEGRHMMDDDV